MLNENEFEKKIEQFKLSLETSTRQSSASKTKIKPNISKDWLMDL